MKPGIYGWMSNHKYHSGLGISNTDLGLINQSPAHYKWKKENPESATDAMNKGQAFHTLTLEPHKFTDRFVLFEGDLRTKEAKARFDEASESGKIVIRDKELTDVQGMVRAVHQHPDASAFLDRLGASFEQSVFWMDEPTGLLCKVRPDIMINNDKLVALVDLKSCRPGANRNEETWQKQIAQYRYHVQAAYYLEGCQVATGVSFLGFIWIAVESEPPYGVNVFLADREMVEEGAVVYRRDLGKFAECMRSGEWPCYPTGVKTVSLPPWGFS